MANFEVITATISSGQSLSSIADLTDKRIVGLQMLPATCSLSISC